MSVNQAHKSIRILGTSVVIRFVSPFQRGWFVTNAEVVVTQGPSFKLTYTLGGVYHRKFGVDRLSQMPNKIGHNTKS